MNFYMKYFYILSYTYIFMLFLSFNSLALAESFIHTIEYGQQIVQDIELKGGHQLLFDTDPSNPIGKETRIIGNIVLHGGESSVHFNNATMEGNIYIGVHPSMKPERTVKSTFVGRNAHLAGAILMGGDAISFTYGNNFTTTAPIQITSINNSIIFEKGSVINSGKMTISSPTAELATNTIELREGVSFAKKVEIITVGNSVVSIDKLNGLNGSTLTFIRGNADITLNYAQDLSSFFNFAKAKGVTLTFAKGFIYKGDITIPIGVASAVAKPIFVLAGATIQGNIIVPAHWGINITENSADFLTGKVLQNGKIFIAGYSNFVVETAEASVPFVETSASIRENTLWKGDIVAKETFLKIFDSTVEGSLLLEESKNVFIENSKVNTGIVFTNMFAGNEVSIKNSEIGNTNNIAIDFRNSSVKLLIAKSTIEGDIKISSINASDITLNNSTVYGALSIMLPGGVAIEGSRIEKGLYLEGGKSSTITIRHSSISSIAPIGIAVKNFSGNIVVDNSNVDGNIVINSGETNFLEVNASTIHGSIIGDELSTNLAIQNSTLNGEIFQAKTITVANGINITNPNATIVASSIVLQENNNSKKDYFFSTRNGRLDDRLRISGEIRIQENSETIFFEGDLSLEAGRSDSIQLVNTGSSSRVPKRVGFFLTEPIRNNVTGIVIDNVLSGFDVKPILITDVAGGYNLYLQESATVPNTYSLILGTYSASNYLYAASILIGEMHTKAVWNAVEQRSLLGMIERQVKNKNSTINGSDITTWATTTVLGAEIQKTTLSPFSTLLSSTTAGIEIGSIPITKNIYTNINFFFNYGISTTDMKNDRNSVDTLLFTNTTLGVESIWNFTLVEGKQNLFLSATGAFEFNWKVLDRNIIVGKDRWETFSGSAGVKFGYIATLKGFIISPYIGTRYVYTDSTSKIFADMNTLEINERHLVIGSVGITTGYYFPIGIKPYVEVGIEKNLYNSTASAVRVVERDLAYKTDNLLGDITLGLEYGVNLSTLEIYTGFEVGMEVDLEEIQNIYPSGTIALGLRF